MYLDNRIKNLSIIAFLIINLLLFCFTFDKYSGNLINFFLLFITTNFYIYHAFRYSHLFLDKTLSIFLWLGFFYKLCIILIYKTSFPEGGGAFKYNGTDYDKLLIFSYVGISSFIIGSIFINKLKKFYEIKNNENKTKILLNFYKRYQKILCLIFLILIIFVGSLNYITGFYQKGLLPKNDLPFLLGNFLKWMLIFGLTSISCLLIEYDIKIFKKISFLVLFLFFFELAFSNFSLLSRSIIFSGSAVIFSIYLNYNNFINKNLNNSLVFNFLILLLIFLFLIFPINSIRQYLFVDAKFKSVETAKSILENDINKKKLKEIIKSKTSEKEINEIIESEKSEKEKIKVITQKIIEERKNKQNLDFRENLETLLFVIKNRFVGLDGMAAVTSYPEKNFNLFIDGLNENIDYSKYGFYQKTFILPFEADYNNHDYQRESERQYGIILPGILPFLSYTGSLSFLIISAFIIHIFCSAIEIISRQLTNGCLIFSSYIGYVLGYRLIHFGYLPKQSYLILSAIILMVVLLFMLQYVIFKIYHENSGNKKN